MIIASRSLKIIESRSEVTVCVNIFLPELGGVDWVCRYEIGWPNGVRRSAAAGFDSAQALHLALQKIGIDLYMSNFHAAGKLMWRKQNDGYGFPVPKNGRDFLVGSDKEFDG